MPLNPQECSALIFAAETVRPLITDTKMRGHLTASIRKLSKLKNRPAKTKEQTA